MSDQQRTIVIAGGGTAGWMVAATLAHFLEGRYRLRLVESDAIGTVGVGEATIPQLRLLLDALGLDEDAFLRATGGTFKLGIEFDGWRREGERYMHAFGAVGREVGLLAFQHTWLRGRALGVAEPLAAYSLNEIAARERRMHRGEPVGGAAVPAMPYAFHFDAGLFAAYLRRFAELRDVERIEGRIVGVDRHGGTGDIAALALEGDRRVDGDLFVDATGFRSLLLGETLGVAFESWAHWLPCDRALAAPSAPDATPLPYTRAIARAAGWQWRIPLQHRTGNGLVYASAYLSDDSARDLLLANLEREIQDEPRVIRFTAGRRRAAWERNVVAVGLASGFLEPLESTSIHLVQSAVSRLLKLLPALPVASALRREYNRQTDYELERIRDFLILHYQANERAEPFWQARRHMGLPDSLCERIALWRESGQIVREHEELFTEVGWLQLLVGQGVEAVGHHPLADAIAPGELADYLRTMAALYAREAARYPRHEEVIARDCAMRRR